MELQEIIDEIWEANKDKFNSKEEVRYIVNAYLRLFHQDLKYIKKGKAERFGNYEPTREGKAFVKQKNGEKKEKLLIKSRINHKNSRLWRLKFIDDSFPD